MMCPGSRMALSLPAPEEERPALEAASRPGPESLVRWSWRAEERAQESNGRVAAPVVRC
jgi:hypothetical protein